MNKKFSNKLLLVVVIIFITITVNFKLSTGESDSTSTLIHLDYTINDIAIQIADSVSGDGIKRIAVLEFSDIEGQPSELGGYVSERLSSKLLLTKKFDVIENKAIHKVLRGYILPSKRVISDSELAKKLGKLLKADLIVSGTVNSTKTSIEVDLYIVSTETGNVVATASMETAKDSEKILTKDGLLFIIGMVIAFIGIALL